MGDDLAVIKMMGNYFKELAAKGPQDDSGRREYAYGLRKILDQFTDWYKDNACKPDDPPIDKTFGSPRCLPLPATTGIEKLKGYEEKMMPILQDFNSRACKWSHVNVFFEDYLDRIREGWGKRLEKHKEIIGN